MTMTKLANLINPEVMKDMLTAKIPEKIKITPIAKIDNTLVGNAGDTITVPQYAYIGEAEDVAEGVEAGTTVLTATTTKATVKKVVKNVELTDESVLSGYGDPVGETTVQLAKSVAGKIDTDCMDALLTATLKHTDEGIINYDGIVKAVGKFEEEDDTPKVMFIHPNQETQLRLDPNFLDKNKYGLNVVMDGVIGSIAGCQVVKSKRVKENLGKYTNPIVQLVGDEDDGLAALTIYMKRGSSLETGRNIKAKTTLFSVDEHYTAVLSNESKVVLAEFLKEAPALLTAKEVVEEAEQVEVEEVVEVVGEAKSKAKRK